LDFAKAAPVLSMDWIIEDVRAGVNDVDQESSSRNPK